MPTDTGGEEDEEFRRELQQETANVRAHAQKYRSTPCSLYELLCELFFPSSEDLSASDIDRGTVYVCVHVFVRV